MNFMMSFEEIETLSAHGPISEVIRMLSKHPDESSFRGRVNTGWKVYKSSTTRPLKQRSKKGNIKYLSNHYHLVTTEQALRKLEICYSIAMKLQSTLSLILLVALSVQAAPTTDDSELATAGQLSFTPSNCTIEDLLKELGLDLETDLSTGETVR